MVCQFKGLSRSQFDILSSLINGDTCHFISCHLCHCQYNFPAFAIFESDSYRSFTDFLSCNRENIISYFTHFNSSDVRANHRIRRITGNDFNIFRITYHHLECHFFQIDFQRIHRFCNIHLDGCSLLFSVNDFYGSSLVFLTLHHTGHCNRRFID